MKHDAMTSLYALVALVLLCASLTGCDSIPQPPPGPQRSSAANWSNDFLRVESGIIWVVNGTWTHDGKILFRDQRFTTDQFIEMLGEQRIDTNTPISILQEPGVFMPESEHSKFWQAGYLLRTLSLPKRDWKWWREKLTQPQPTNNAPPQTQVDHELMELRQKANTGDRAAEFSLAQHYADSGGESNQMEAVKWYRKAAERGDATAQYFLSFYYLSGAGGVESNRSEAVKWCRKAAEQGLSDAQAALGSCYANGYGVPKDLVEAYKWFNIAASQGEKSVGDWRERLALSMTPSQLAEAQRRSSEFVPKKQGFAD